jgi:hypothetical protein
LGQNLKNWPKSQYYNDVVDWKFLPTGNNSNTFVKYLLKVADLKYVAPGVRTYPGAPLPVEYENKKGQVNWLYKPQLPFLNNVPEAQQPKRPPNP